MTTPPSDEREERRPPTPLGDADDVPDTPYLAGHGADPGGNRTPTALVGSGGLPTVVWVIVGILFVVALVYGFGFIT